MLTPFDEFPVHQTSRPFSTVGSTDFAWDDGYFFGVQVPDENLFLFTGLRVSPNSDVVAAYAGVAVDGRQHTTRLSRIWRPDFDTSVGSLRYDFIEPYRDIHLQFGKNESPLSFDLHWYGEAPAYLEKHHVATNRGRLTTDQSRYTQCGSAQGVIHFDGRTFEVKRDRCSATRDHSWGLYDDRPPLKGVGQWLPPKELPENPRALRMWLPFRTDRLTGFFHVHEDADGDQANLNDVFGTPFEGEICYGWDGQHIKLSEYKHELEFIEGTRALKSGRVTLKDDAGRNWLLEAKTLGQPWHPATIGYHGGSWKDGGSNATYHGNDGQPALEWDELDISQQPFDYSPYGIDIKVPLHGVEHLVEVIVTDPAGEQHKGCGQLEMFIQGPYRPYNFE